MKHDASNKDKHSALNPIDEDNGQSNSLVNIELNQNFFYSENESSSSEHPLENFEENKSESSENIFIKHTKSE